MRRTRMTQPTRAIMSNRWIERTQTVADGFPKRSEAQWTIRSLQGEKNMVGRTTQSHFLQIAQDRLAYGLCEGKLLRSPRLWPNNVDDLALPVQILQLQTLHLSRSKSIDHKQHHNRPITDILGTVAACACQHLLNSLPRRSLRECFLWIYTGRHNPRRQSGSAPALRFGIPEKRPE